MARRPAIVRLRITLDAAVYERLKRELPSRGISRFINDAVRAGLRPSEAELARGYRAAAREPWRRRLEAEWAAAETEGWPA